MNVAVKPPHDWSAELDPPTREPKTHNHLIGNRPALDEAWRTDGYWFFRNVLDEEAVARLRRVYVEELEKLGVTDPVGDAPTHRSVRYNGASLADFPKHMEPLAKRRAWQSFVAEPTINQFFVELLQDEPFWVPFVEYRATPPTPDRDATRFAGIHQDGPNSPGIPFRVCWVPVAEIDKEVGGVVFAEGMTEEVNRLPVGEDGSNGMIPPEELADAPWRHTTYRPGDVLLMNRWTPHSGLTNLSDRFRLSFDARVMGVRDECPVIGEVVSIADDYIAVRDDAGVKRLRLDPTTYVRNSLARRLQGPAILKEFAPGARVIAAHQNGLATVIRPPHSS